MQAVSAALALNYVTPLEVRNPPKNIRTRFEVFTIYLDITREDFKHGKLFGWIEVSDYYGLRSDGWEKLLYTGPGRVSLLSRDCCHSIKMRNNGRLKIGNPSSRHSVPFSSSMQICILLYATTENNDEFFEVCNHQSDLDFSPFLDDESKTSSCKYLVAEGDDGHIRMHYILLKNAVDATIKVNLGTVSNRRVCGVILAYYDEFDYGDDKLVKSFYKASLFESFDGSFKGGDVPLTRSILAVPIPGSLIIEARLTDFESGNVVLYGHCVFPSNHDGSFNNQIKNKDYTLDVEITWSED